MNHPRQHPSERFLNPALAGALRSAFDACRADEGTLWLIDEADAALLPVWNSGPHADRIVGKFRQPLDSGLISLVCAAELPLCENAVYRHTGQDPALDRALSLLTCAMIAVPFRLRGEVRGVVSCVKLKDAGSSDDPDPPPFTPEDMRRVAGAVHAIEKDIEAADAADA